MLTAVEIVKKICYTLIDRIYIVSEIDIMLRRIISLVAALSLFFVFSSCKDTVIDETTDYVTEAETKPQRMYRHRKQRLFLMKPQRL